MAALVRGARRAPAPRRLIGALCLVILDLRPSACAGAACEAGGGEGEVSCEAAAGADEGVALLQARHLAPPPPDHDPHSAGPGERRGDCGAGSAGSASRAAVRPRGEGTFAMGEDSSLEGQFRCVPGLTRVPPRGGGPVPLCGVSAMEVWRDTFAGLLPHDQPKDVCKAYSVVNNRSLFVEADPAGFNNIRLALESAVCLAFKTRRLYRAPVINPAYGDRRLKFETRKLVDKRWVKLPRELHVFDVYDEASFRRVVPTRNASEALTGVKYFATNVRVLLDRAWRLGPSSQHLVMKGGNTNRRLLFQYASSPLFTPHEAYVRLVESAFRLRPELACHAARLLQSFGLRPRGYVALHMRHGSGGFRRQFPPPANETSESIARYLAPVLRHRTVLVLTDVYDASFLEALRVGGRAERVICWANLTRTGDARVFNAQIDMLAAVPAADFVGTPLSTFSLGIVRWRMQAGTHRVGQPVQFVRPWRPAAEGWASIG